MPKYISITPTFNPISLDDYLRVPTMVYTEQQKEIGKLEDYKDKLAYYKALMGNSERAKEIFANYDDIVNQMTDGVGNYTVGDLQALGRRARSSFRDITSKIDVAVQNRAEQQKRKDKDPTNVGDVGSLETYYYNPDYTPTFVSGKELETGIATAAKQLAQALPYNMEGYVDPARSKIAISQGYTPDELNAAYAEATNYNATPTSALGKALRQKLDAINYSSLSPSLRRELGASIINGLQGGARQYSVMANPEYLTPAQRESMAVSRESRAEKAAFKELQRLTGMSNPQEMFDINGKKHYYEFSGQAIRIVDEQGRPVLSFTDSAGNVYPSSGTPGIFKYDNPTMTRTTNNTDIQGVTLKPSAKKVFDRGAFAEDTSKDYDKEGDVTALMSYIVTHPDDVVDYNDLKPRQRAALAKAYPELKDSTKRYRYTIVQNDRQHFDVLFNPNATPNNTATNSGQSTTQPIQQTSTTPSLDTTAAARAMDW